MINVLILPSGSLVAKEIYDSLRYEKNIKLYGTDYDNHNFSSYYFTNYIAGCPNIIDKFNTIIFINNLIKQYNIKYIYPAFDSIIKFLSDNRTDICCDIILPNSQIVDICNSKLDTYKLFGNKIPIPKQYQNSNIGELYNKSNTKFNTKSNTISHNNIDVNNIDDVAGVVPVKFYIKPNIGYGSRNHQIVSLQELYNTPVSDDKLILEVLNGDEYTVDCFTNNNNELLYYGARHRLRMNNGICIHSEYRPEYINKYDDIIHKYSNIINETLGGMKGAWFYQVKFDKSTSDGVLKLLEIGCRISGAMCLNRVMGVNFALLSILQKDGRIINDLNVLKCGELSCYKIYKNYYKTDIKYNIVYCDLDDTLILNNKLNIDIIAFLYKCISNENIKIVLLTRNIGANAVLHKYKLFELFNEVIILSTDKTDKKSEHINQHTKSIFIDDSYIERKDVTENNANCIAISPTNIELLLNTL